MSGKMSDSASRNITLEFCKTPIAHSHSLTNTYKLLLYFKSFRTRVPGKTVVARSISSSAYGRTFHLIYFHVN